MCLKMSLFLSSSPTCHQLTAVTTCTTRPGSATATTSDTTTHQLRPPPWEEEGEEACTAWTPPPEGPQQADQLRPPGMLTDSISLPNLFKRSSYLKQNGRQLPTLFSATAFHALLTWFWKFFCGVLPINNSIWKLLLALEEIWPIGKWYMELKIRWKQARPSKKSLCQ